MVVQSVPMMLHVAEHKLHVRFKSSLEAFSLSLCLAYQSRIGASTFLPETWPCGCSKEGLDRKSVV